MQYADSVPPFYPREFKVLADNTVIYPFFTGSNQAVEVSLLLPNFCFFKCNINSDYMNCYVMEKTTDTDHTCAQILIISLIQLILA